MAKKKEPNEFDQRKTIIDLQASYDKEKHKRTIEELKYRRESDSIHHEHEMERQRIRSAEIRKSQMRKGEGGWKY